jgi:transcriptional regulator with XRE-family HTH domain
MPDRPRGGAFTGVLETFGRRLRSLRISKGITQEAAAQAAGVSTQALRNWEAGKHEPTAEHLQRLTGLYGLTHEQLMENLWGLSLGNGKSANGASIKGYLLAGLDESDPLPKIGSIPLPEFVQQDYPNLFWLLVRGNSLAWNGIQDGDLVLIDPKGGLEDGSIQVVQMDSSLYARLVRWVDGRMELRERPEAEECPSNGNVQILGRLVWHLRRM